MLWLVGPETGWMSAWARGLRSAGWTVARAATLSELGTQSGAGVALVDAKVLGGGPAFSLSELRAALPACRLALVAPPEDLLGSRGRDTLGSGADDFLPSNLAPSAAVERVRALLDAAGASGLSSRDGRLRLDEERRTLWLRPGKPPARPAPELTPREFELLRLLLSPAGAPLSRARALEALCGDRSDDVTPGVVDRHVAALRRKLGKLGARIKTVRGKGYVLDDA